MNLQRISVMGILTLALVSVLAVNASPQRAVDEPDRVAREVRDLRFAIERAAALSAQVTLAAMQANATQGRISSITVELGNRRSQAAMITAQLASQEKIVADFERDFPEAVREPSEGLRLPQYQRYVSAKAQLEAQRQIEDMLRVRESELVGLLNREQERWDELAARIAALERSLPGQGR